MPQPPEVVHLLTDSNRLQQAWVQKRSSTCRASELWPHARQPGDGYHPKGDQSEGTTPVFQTASGLKISPFPVPGQGHR